MDDNKLEAIEDRLTELEDLFHGNPRKGVTGMRQLMDETHASVKRVEQQCNGLTHDRDIEQAERRGTRRVINGVVVGIIVQILATAIMAWQAIGA